MKEVDGILDSERSSEMVILEVTCPPILSVRVLFENSGPTLAVTTRNFHPCFYITQPPGEIARERSIAEVRQRIREVRLSVITEFEDFAAFAGYFSESRMPLATSVEERCIQMPNNR